MSYGGTYTIRGGYKRYGVKIKKDRDGNETGNIFEYEHSIQVELFKWAEYMSQELTELKLLHAIPNGGYRHPKTAKALKAEGVKPGVPDIFLPIARGVYHGLYIELKSKVGKLSEAQKEWQAELIKQGYSVRTVFGLEDAKTAILNYIYMNGK